MAVCDCGCNQKIEKRKHGRPGRFYSSQCRTVFYSQARRLGAKALKRRRRNGPVPKRPRVTGLKRMEAEAMASGHPGTFPARSIRVGRSLTIVDLGGVALK